MPAKAGTNAVCLRAEARLSVYILRADPSLPNVEPALLDRPTSARTASCSRRWAARSASSTPRVCRCRTAQGKTLAVMAVSGGSQSFNAVNQMRILGRWMRMITIPNQSAVAKAFTEFAEARRMRPSAFCER